MNYKFLSSFFYISSLSSLLLVSLSANAFAEMPQDSIGVERKGKKVFVLYKVGAGETLSSISRRYKTTVEAIKAENSLSGSGLKLGSVIKVPYTTGSSLAGKKVHTVAANQTLYSIARTYNVSTEDIKKWNNLTANDISLGQQLIISGDKEETTKSSSSNQSAEQTVVSSSLQTNQDGQRVHVVEASQGLFSIARMHNIPVEDLRKWNNLKNDNLKVGQELVLEGPKQASVVQHTTAEPVAQAETPENPEINQPNTTEEPKEAQNKTTEKTLTEEVQSASTTAQTSVKEPEVKQPDNSIPKKEEKAVESQPETNYTIANSSGYVKKVESGLAEVISGESGGDLFLALHRTAPVGTIMQIRNQMNDLSVFVKVIGKLPDTGANDKIVVKISQKAYERLAAVDKRFRVELSYMP